jgi:hypothetical protein
VTPAQTRTLGQIQAELNRLVRYDDESIVHEMWIRQRYDLGAASSYLPARPAAVLTAWHEAGRRAGRRGTVQLSQHPPRSRQPGAGARHR